VKLAGIILAAGESRRMGRDKALLEYRGDTFLGRLARVFLSRVDPLIVVLGHHAGEIARALPANDRVRPVINERYREGMLTSLQAGIAALPEDAEAALFTLVDLPAVEESTLDALIGAFQASGKPLAIPRNNGRRGHPVAASRAILDQIAALPADASPKDVIRARREDTVFLDVEDSGVWHDVDLPHDYQSLVGG